MMSAEQPKDTELDDFEKELNLYIESEEKNKKEKQNMNVMEKEKGQGTDSSVKSPEKSGARESDNEDSEVDDYNLTEDQKRALEELDNLKSELGYPDEDPPEYDVTERLKILNEELKNDPTPVEKQHESKVGFKQNLVDLVAPPPDFSEDETEDKKGESPKGSKPPQKQSEDKVDDTSETISDNSKKTNSGKNDKVLIEIDGQFKLVNADDVRAKDLGYVMDNERDKENDRKQVNKTEKDKTKLQPTPPGKPRPATAVNSRRNVRTAPSKPRPQSAGGNVNHGSALNNFNYNSPYALSPREKQLMEERKKALEKQRQDEDKRRKQDEETKERENQEAFEYWLKKKRENDRRRRIIEEEERKKNAKEDRKRIREFEKNKEFATYDILYYKKEDNEEAFKGWLKEKNAQFKKEKLLKRRQEQEMHEGYYIRSREECDKAYKQWLKHKAIEARKARQAERTKAKLQRLAARRARKGITLSRSIREAQSFRYVDYYGYRF